MKNCRPVSNLPFLSKILEKLVVKRLESHLSSHRLHENLQSAYRTGHSTGTALLNVHHGIAEALDRMCMVALVLLDLSAAFDVINHKIFQTRLEHSFGVTGSAISWIKSYLGDRSQCVAIGMTTSEDKCLKTPVLNYLDWLPVIHMSQYKILMYNFKALRETCRSVSADKISTVWVWIILSRTNNTWSDIR